jgi:hypothetical protein
MAEPESCARCRFSLEAPGTLFCRRRPPQLLVLTSNAFAGMPGSERVAARWPEVSVTAWCGEYQSAQAAEGEVARG